MRVLVTGAAGFIGSHLAERLLSDGHQVVAVDKFTVPEWNRFKRHNVKLAQDHPNYQLFEADLLQLDLAKLLDGVDVVFHHAAIAGVRKSWGSHFQDYVELNILTTQRLLEACTNANITKFIYASSSSVYGGTDGPTGEDSPTLPISPYGTTKLAGENLVRMYHVNYGLPTTSLRYFTVYGPRQRPDMAFHKFLKAAHDNEPISVYGDGHQTRDFTYISDAIDANLKAMSLPEHGNVFNIGGAERSSVLDVLTTIENVTGQAIKINYLPKQPGDPMHTWADISEAQRKLGYDPKVKLEDGLAREWGYIQQMYKA